MTHRWPRVFQTVFHEGLPPRSASLVKDGETCYNDLAQWRYDILPVALGCQNWDVSSVSTQEELEQALKVCNHETSHGHFIEVRMKRYDAAPVAMVLHKAVGTLYSA